MRYQEHGNLSIGPLALTKMLSIDKYDRVRGGFVDVLASQVPSHLRVNGGLLATPGEYHRSIRSFFSCWQQKTREGYHTT